LRTLASFFKHSGNDFPIELHNITIMEISFSTLSFSAQQLNQVLYANSGDNLEAHPS